MKASSSSWITKVTGTNPYQFVQLIYVKGFCKYWTCCKDVILAMDDGCISAQLQPQLQLISVFSCSRNALWVAPGSLSNTSNQYARNNAMLEVPFGEKVETAELHRRISFQKVSFGSKLLAPE